MAIMGPASPRALRDAPNSPDRSSATDVTQLAERRRAAGRFVDTAAAKRSLRLPVTTASEASAQRLLPAERSARAEGASARSDSAGAAGDGPLENPANRCATAGQSPRGDGSARSARRQAERLVDSHTARTRGVSVAEVRQERQAKEAELEERRQRRRAQRFEARHGVRFFTTLARLRECGWKTVRDGGPVLRITEALTGTRAGWSGVSTCGSVWVCPECADKVQASRRAELVELITTATARGCSVLLITLTMRHTAGDRLADLWDDLSKAWAAVNRDGTYRRRRDSFGYVGWVKSVEVTTGAHGWHVHIHCLMVLEGACSQDRAEEFGELLWSPWSRYLMNRPGRSPVRDAFDVRVGRGALAAMGEYLAKTSYPDDDQEDAPTTDVFRESYEGLASEMTLSTHKQARGYNQTPFQLLRDILSNGMRMSDGETVVAAPEVDVARWHEWEAASRGRRQIAWSDDLRKWADLGEEKSDEEIAAEEAGGEDVIGLPVETWRAVRRYSWVLLDLAETGGRDAVVAYLDRRGLEWFDAQPAPPSGRAA